MAGRVPIAGRRLGADRGISKVEVADRRRLARRPRLSTPISNATWVQWLVAVGRRARATTRSRSGRPTAPASSRPSSRPPPAPDGARGHHTIQVAVRLTAAARPRCAERYRSDDAPTTLPLRPARPLRGRHGRRARQPHLLPPGPRRRPRRLGRPREGPGRGPRRAARRAPRRARASAASPRSDGAAPADGRRAPLDEPLNEAFRATADARLGRRRRADPRRGAGEDEDERGRDRRRDEDDDDDEDGPGPPRASRLDAPDRPPASFVERGPSRVVVAAGRLPCPLCGQPLDPAGPHLPAPQRPLRQLSRSAVRASTAATTLDVLREGEIEVVGRLVGSSQQRDVRAGAPGDLPGAREPVRSSRPIYKPTAGERPLDDFPDGTLTRREVAA